MSFQGSWRYTSQNIGDPTDGEPRRRIMDWTLELVVVPVSDVDRAKAFYTEQLGFRLDVDHRAGDDFRVVQATPPGSGCSIAIMRNTAMAAGTLHGLHLCVSDIDIARAQLVEKGVAPSEMFHFGEGGQTPGPDPQRASYGTFLTFNDPDGNTWLVQEVKRAAAAA
jgi:catechol 2,3-dioxygenase-like lactoylglutathione lyase family enzyme